MEFLAAVLGFAIIEENPDGDDSKTPLGFAFGLLVVWGKRVPEGFVPR